jgi:DNA polymerase elongation subunit (family B)
MDKEYRPRLDEEENKLISAYRAGKLGLLNIPDLEVDFEPKSPAKILIFDIETAPLRSYTWGVWKQNVAPSQMLSDWFMITWAAKWLFEDEVMSDKLTKEEILGEDDKRITKSIWELINKADIVVAHNANNFDVKHLNTRFLLNDLEPPMPFQVIDTLEHVRKRFAFKSNRLDYINDKLGIGRKLKTEFELWAKCMAGDEEAIREMEEYNIQDVAILEETYLKIRPWIRSHPNIGLFIEDDVDTCPNCGGTHLIWGGTPYATSANRYEAFRCGECGSIGRSAKSLKKAGVKSSTRPTAR